MDVTQICKDTLFLLSSEVKTTSCNVIDISQILKHCWWGSLSPSPYLFM